MKYFKFLLLFLILIIPTTTFSGVVTQSTIGNLQTDDSDSEAYGVYDLRDRKTYVQVTLADNDPDPQCIHIQIFQQDRGCSELDFEDVLTANDTVIYDMDNLVRNDGTPVPINLDDDSYGAIVISEFNCDNRDLDDGNILGNFRIIDDTGYEYRMNLFTGDPNGFLSLARNDDPIPPARANITIPFNTVNGASQADVYAYVTLKNVDIDGDSDGPTADTVYNEEKGVTFDVFQLDENENRLSCDRKTIGCGPDINFHYGINEDYPASRGDNLLCEGAGLLPDQKHGYISLENASFLSSLDTFDAFGFICVYGLNNGNGTGSMDECRVPCIFGYSTVTPGICNSDPNDP